VVPSIARVWYLVRGENREAVDELWDRVMKCVSGAAEMTETTYEVQMIKAIHNVLQNGPLTDVLFEAFERVGPPEFGPEERAFAEEISRTIPASQRQGAMEGNQVPEEFRDRLLCDVVLPRAPKDLVLSHGQAARGLQCVWHPRPLVAVCGPGGDGHRARRDADGSQSRGRGRL